MHTDIKSDKAISLLLEKFPKFAESVDLDEGPYSILGDFAIYLRDGMKNNVIEDGLLNQSFEFLNLMGSSNDPEVHNLLTVGILEILTDTKESQRVAQKKLKGQALEFFNEATSFWYDKQA